MSTKRASKSKFEQESKIGLEIGLCLVAVLIISLTESIALFLTLVVGCIGMYFLGRRLKKEKLQKLYDQLTFSISEHESALISYFKQCRIKDNFGNVDDSRWQKQIDVFLRTKVVPQIAEFSTWRNSDWGMQAASMVHRKTTELIERQIDTNPLAQIEASDLTPLEYEIHCGDLMKAAGWHVQMTQASRDHGADFIAEKDGIRLIAQCKRYSQPVGNKAVQEVNSAMRLYNGNRACVIAPMGFTKQAQSEALGHSIHLLHHLALSSFSEKLLQSKSATTH